MSNPVLRMALSCAERGWPVFPCLWDSKVPLTRHGYLDASTDPAQVSEWFARHPHRNLAVATGAPGPDVLDIDYRGPAAHGFPALRRLRAAGLLDGAAAQVRTPGGGRHVYFAGSGQRTAHLAAAHVDFLAAGGYVMIPPSRVSGKPYQFAEACGGHGGLDWDAAAKILEPSRSRPRPSRRRHHRGSGLTRWPAGSPPSPRVTATPACSGPPTAPWNTSAPPPTSAPWPPPPARPGSRKPRSTALSAPPAAPPRQVPSHPATTSKEPAEMTSNPRPPAAPAAAAQRADDPAELRDQVRRLPAEGGTYRSIAAAAGLAPATLHDLASGRRRPTPATAKALGKVSSSTLARARLDAGGTRLRLRALHVMGHGSARISRTLGVREMTIRSLTRGDAPTVSAALRDAVADLYDAWWDKRAPERDRRERAAATAARRRAIAGNWCAGAGLDDDQLDVPGYKPKSKWKPATGTGTAPDINPPDRLRKSKRQDPRQPRHPNPAAGRQLWH